MRHLLHETSGLPTLAGELPLADFDSGPRATERQARTLARVTLSHPAGAAFEYSNANYNLLGLIIEAVSGEPYAGYLENHLLTPLGLCHTYTAPAAAKQNGLAVGHRCWFGFPIAAPNMPLPHGSLPAGLLISTAEDLARYLMAHLNGGRGENAQILSAEGVAELQRGVADFRTLGISVGKYGMGWFESAIGATKLVWHSGTLPHCFAYMALLPAQKKGVVLLFNASQHWMNPVLTEVAEGVAARLVGAPPAPSRFGAIPWLLRGQALIPVLLAAEVAATLGQLHRWRREPARRPVGAVQAARRFYNGQVKPREFLPTIMKFSGAYNYHNNLLALAQELALGRMPKMRPEALIFGYSQLLKGWTVMDRLGEIQAPTLLLAGRHDCLFPTEHQVALAAGIPNARLEIIECAGHNPHMERPADVIRAISEFISATSIPARTLAAHRA